MISRVGPLFLALLMAAIVGSPVRALEPSDNQFPNSIIAPEPGTVTHHRSGASKHGESPGSRMDDFAKGPLTKNLLVRRGSAGSVLPAPLPRTPLIPPEGGGSLAVHAPAQEQVPTIVPGLPGLRAVPNLPHGPETFQDRASRCAFQQGLFNVPANASTQYMSACSM
jgi:hypothetical protein